MSDHRDVMEASLAALRRGDAATLALVVETEGSTYARAGAMALFGAADGQVGWLSGGCLEPEIELRAQVAAAGGRIDWMDIDTRDDEDLLSGSAVGCRGRLRLALLPLQQLDGWAGLVADWLQGCDALQLQFDDAEDIGAGVGARQVRWRLPASDSDIVHSMPYRVRIAPPASLLVFGAGPETPCLLPLLRRLGWLTTLVERRERWRRHARFADRAIEQAPASALGQVDPGAFTAALVMQHNFELDREALVALADAPVPFVGLLGPVRRREDLFRVMPAAARIALQPRLRSPVGLKLGGQGAEAIALSIAAQLQAWRSGEAT